MVKYFLLITLSFSTIIVIGQGEWLTFPSDSIKPNASDNLNFTKNNGSLEIIEDDRFEKIEKFTRADEETVQGIKVDGFRVLIYFSQDKSISQQQKAHFMTLYPKHRAYLDYLAPNYRVRVGNFRSKLEAEALKAEILIIFPTAIVIKDKIQLPILEESEE